MSEMPDQEPQVTTSDAVPSNKAGAGSPWSGISRDITDEELQSSSGARKMLLYIYDKSERECIRLYERTKDFHEIDKRLGVSEEKIRQYSRLSNVEDLCKIVGGAILGFAANHIETLQWWLVGVLALVLIVGPFVYHYRVCREAKK